MTTARAKLVTFPERALEVPDLPAALAALAASQRELAAAVRQLAVQQEIFQESMPAAREAEILGVSACTIRRRRESRRNQRLLQATG